MKLTGKNLKHNFVIIPVITKADINSKKISAPIINYGQKMIKIKKLWNTMSFFILI